MRAQVLQDRLTAQLLAGPAATSVGAVVERLLAVQAQDLRAGRLAVRARSRGLGASNVDAALASGEVVVSWVNRGTLHLVRAEDHGWLHAVTTPQLLTTCTTRLRQEGVSEQQADRGTAAIRTALRDGPRTREQLREALTSADVPTQGQALVHVLFLAGLRRICVRGPMVGKDQAFVLADEWLPRAKPVDREVAMRELARRYLAAHAHSTDRDLAKWAKISLGDARRALAGVSVPAYKASEVPERLLLGGFDEVLMGWVSRDFVLDGAQQVVTMNGIFKPIALVDGIAQATWTLPKGRVVLKPFGEPVEGFEDEIADVERFLSC